MSSLKQLFMNNEAWAARMLERDPQFFDRLSRQQAPEYLWIGCSDSRVPTNEIVGLLPGQLFVHRNVANLVNHTDLNCLSVVQFAVESLRVKHIIVCGHYGCGGVRAAIQNENLGLIDNWLRHIQEIRCKHGDVLDGIIDESNLMDRMCELNVIEQVRNVSRTTVVEGAWWHGQSLTIHGWIYSLENGLLRDLGICASRKEEVEENYASAVKALNKSKVALPSSSPIDTGRLQSSSPAVTPKPVPEKQASPQETTRPEPAPPSTTPPKPGGPPPLPPLK